MPEAPRETLPVGADVVGAFASAEGRRDFSVPLEKGESLVFEVEQRDLDVVVELTRPGDLAPIVIDSWSQSWGTESFCLVAETTGDYHLGIRPLTPPSAGTFRLSSAVSRAGEDDRSCGSASAASARAAALFDAEGLSATTIEAFEGAAALWRGRGSRYREALLWQELAGLYRRKADVDSEIPSLERARELLESAEEHLVEWTQVVTSLGYAYLLDGDVPKAQTLVDAALARALAVGDPVAEAFARGGLADLLRARGEAHGAIHELERALVIWERRGQARNQANTWYRIAQVYGEDLGLFREAVDTVDRALEVWRNLGWQTQQTYGLIVKGWALYRLGELDLALAAYDRALDIATAHDNIAGQIAASDRRGTILKEKGAWDAAEDAYRSALALARGAGSHVNVGHVRSNLGWLRLQRGRWAEARRELEKARAVLTRVGDRDAMAHLFVGLAMAERGLANHEAALGYFQRALSELSSLRRSALGRGGRLPIDPLWQSYHDAHVELLIEMAESSGQEGDLLQAFQAAELARAWNFLSLVLESDLDLRAKADPQHFDREKALITAFDGLESRRSALLDLPGSGGEIADVERRQRALQVDLERTREEIRSSHPRFSQVVDPQPPDLDGIRRFLPDGSRLLAYVLGPRRSFLFLVGPDNFELFELPPRDVLQHQSLAARLSLAEPSGYSAVQRRLALQELSTTLLGPVRDKLDGVGHLLIVASGELGLLPFSALPFPSDSHSQADSSRQTNPGRPVGDRFEFSYLPAAASVEILGERLARMKARVEPSGARGRLAILADPVFSRHDPRLGARVRGEDLGPDRAFARLPHTLSEAEGILQFFPEGSATAALGFEATREWALTELGDYAYLHFASHAEIDDEIPGRSRILLSRFDDRGRPVAGDLRLGDIFTLDLTADLVILSACRSALGRRIEGDGLVGLARGFFYAGAGRLIVSLWDVDDQATSSLMVELYRALIVDGASPSQALQAAQAHVRSDPRWSHPYYWAGFVVQGPGW